MRNQATKRYNLNLQHSWLNIYHILEIDNQENVSIGCNNERHTKRKIVKINKLWYWQDVLETNALDQNLVHFKDVPHWPTVSSQITHYNSLNKGSSRGPAETYGKKFLVKGCRVLGGFQPVRVVFIEIIITAIYSSSFTFFFLLFFWTLVPKLGFDYARFSVIIVLPSWTFRLICITWDYI